MKSLRTYIFSLLEKDIENKYTPVYEFCMLIIIILSIIPLMFIETNIVFKALDIITTSVFIVDYLMRWFTADLKINKGKLSFLIYPFTIMAIIDLLSILPSMNVLNKAFKVFRIMRLLKILRILKVIRYSRRLLAFFNVLKKEKNILVSVLVLAILYIFITALIMFNVEPHYNPITKEPTFTSFFKALYWSTVTLTTVGYGDMCPVTDYGRLISMLSSIFGVAIIALPSGVITASYLDELRELKKNSKDEDLSKKNTN